MRRLRYTFGDGRRPSGKEEVLDLLLIVWLTYSVRSIVKEKGRPVSVYVRLAIGLWLLGGFLGATVGFVAGVGGLLLYSLALLGELAGALIAYRIALKVEPIEIRSR